VHVPVTRMREIVDRRRGITADTALRLARYLSTSAELWVNLQSAHDLGVARQALAEQIKREVRPREAARSSGKD
jgi:antitoxin HigA-1